MKKASRYVKGKNDISSRYQNAETHASKHRTNITSLNPRNVTRLPHGNLTEKWSKLSFEKKVGWIVFSFLAMGFTVTAIYYLYPLIAESVRANPNTRPDLSNYGWFSRRDSKQSLRSLIAQADIKLQPAFREELTRNNQASVIRKYDKQADTIRSVLPQAINHKVLKGILKEENFGIELVPQNDIQLTHNGQEFPTAKYLPIRNRVLVVADTDMTELEIIKTLRNELHHASVRNTNFKMPNNDQNKLQNGLVAIRPFLKTSWQTDDKLFSEHQFSTQSGFARVNRFKYLLRAQNKSSSRFTDEQSKSELNNYLKAITNYRPQIHHVEFPPHLEKVIKNKIKKLQSGKSYFETGNEILYIEAMHSYSNTLVIKYSHCKAATPRDLAEAFFKDVEGYQDFKDTPYQKYTDYDKALELSSFIQEIEPTVLQTFFHEWCEYFSNYHNVKNYCSL